MTDLCPVCGKNHSPFCCGHCESAGNYIDGAFYRFVCCGNSECEARGPIKKTEAEAIAAWNTRATGWHPIETAPRDGTVIDVCVGSIRFPDCKWTEDGQEAGWIDTNTDDWLDERTFKLPSHWRHRPTAPEEPKP